MAASPDRCEKLLQSALDSLTRGITSLRQVRDPQARSTLAVGLLASLRDRQQAIVDLRDSAIAELAALGNSYSQLADITGLTRGRVAQIVQARKG